MSQLAFHQFTYANFVEMFTKTHSDIPLYSHYFTSSGIAGCAATENILLAAAAIGISSCWVAGDKKPYDEDIRNLLSVPQNYKLVSLIALGYDREVAEGAPKRSLTEVLHWEKFKSS